LQQTIPDPTAHLAIRLAVSLLPVILFLFVLLYLDSYKLVRLRLLLATVVVGCAVAVLCVPINRALMGWIGVDATTYARYGAPLVEEFFKAAYVAVLIRGRRVGFMVDAAIAGFAVGAGFAIVENMYYVRALEDGNIVLWIVRGFGTAVMHGGTTAVFGIISKNLFDRDDRRTFVFLPGLAVAFAIHSLYNHFVLPPVVATVAIHVVLPLVILGVFYHSERSTRRWLGTQMDVDAELLEMIRSGRVSETRIGRYFQSVRDQFPPSMVFDMLCYLRLHVELAISAKGLLLMREAGFDAAPPDDVEEKFAELRHLEREIGTTGLLALHPFLHSSSRDLWQLHMLGK
jgi:RsiW-degrading membrane proteinase PrsW (M82 family)